MILPDCGRASIEATIRPRHDLGLTRRTAVVGATGASYSLASGIAPGKIAA